MTSEAISNALNLLDDDMIRIAAELREKGRKEERGRYRRWGMTAACLCLFAVSGVILGIIYWRSTPPAAESAAPQIYSSVLPETKIPVSIHTLLAEQDAGVIEEQAQELAFVPVGQYRGVYEKAASVEGCVLAESAGADVPEAQGWSFVLGHRDMQYLIRRQGEEYSLWKFLCFDAEEYSYSDVLTLIYHIDSAEHIRQIRIDPAAMDNTDEGRRIREEIGSRTVTGRDSIEIFYQILAAMTCYGQNRWDRIDYGDVEADVEGKSSSHEAVRLGRYLTIVTDYGNEIDGLKYTAVSHMFYEFSGIAYEPLPEEDARMLSGILGIDE